MAEQDKRLDETVPGGKYLAADGKAFVDAWGKDLTGAAAAKDDAKPDAKSDARKGA